MILPVNFKNNIKVYNIVNKSSKILSFGGSNDIDEFQKRLEEEVHTNNNNSSSLYESISKGKFAEAAKKIEKFGFDFNPNWSNEKGIPLLAALYDLNSLSSKIRGKISKKYRNDIITRIVSHPEFIPNRIFYPYKNGQDHKTTYIDIAVKNNDIFLVQMLSAYGASLDCYSDKELSDLEAAASHNKVILYALMTQFCDGTAKDAMIRDLKYEIKNLKKELKKSKKGEYELPDKRQTEEIDKIKGIDDIKVQIARTVPESLDKLGGMQEAKKSINSFIIKPWSGKARKLLKENNIAMPNGFMMYGPPGCGKTYITQVIAKQTGFPMYVVDLGEIGDSYAYTVNNSLKKIFNQLERQYKRTHKPSILFLDEIDSVAASRKLSNSDWKRDEINTLIALLNNASEKGIIVIGATNYIDNVDQAVLRTGRFDKKIEIKLPDREERRDIIKKLVEERKILADWLPYIDEFADLTEGKTPSDLSAIINACGREAICDGKEHVTKEDFIKMMQELKFDSMEQRSVIKGFDTERKN